MVLLLWDTTFQDEFKLSNKFKREQQALYYIVVTQTYSSGLTSDVVYKTLNI